MAKKVKCPTCEKMNEKSEVVDFYYKKRYYCKDCYYEKLEKDNVVGNTKADHDELYEYIKLKYGRKPDGQIFQQMKRFKDEFNYTYEWMLLTLKYVFEIEKLPVKKDSGIGIIPYYHTKAQKYYYNLWEVMDKNDEASQSRLKQIKKVNINWDSKYTK